MCKLPYQRNAESLEIILFNQFIEIHSEIEYVIIYIHIYTKLGDFDIKYTLGNIDTEHQFVLIRRILSTRLHGPRTDLTHFIEIS